LTDDGSVFAEMGYEDARTAVERAVTELRAGRAIAVGERDRVVAVAAVDGIRSSLYDAFSDTGRCNTSLTLSAARAGALRLPADGPVAIAVGGLDWEGVCRLAAGRGAPKPSAWKPAGLAGLAGIALCKQALLLPAVLVGDPVPGKTLPAAMHRVDAEDVHSVIEKDHHAVEIVSQARVPIAGDAEATFVVFRGGAALRDQIAIVVGSPEPAQPVLVRLHSACLTGDLFRSLRCDCGDQLRSAIDCLKDDGGGVLLYLDQEGRGIGLRSKMRAYALQDDGLDTIDADAVLGFGADERRFEIAAGMLAALGYQRVRLLTNNPDKVDALKGAGLEVVGRRPLLGPVTPQNRSYLATKSRRAGHLLDGALELHQPGSGACRSEASS
jgi:GTP cyclohydrolase II